MQATTPRGPARGPAQHRRAPRRRPPNRWRRFVATYGWRAYALPVLVLLTVAALIPTGSTGSHDPPSAARPGTRAAAVASAGNAAGANLLVGGIGASAPARPPTGSPPTTGLSLGDDGTSCSTNSYAKLILVSISRQHLWACQGAKEVNNTPVTTGATAGHDQTPLGSWRVQGKQRNRYLVGPGYRQYVHYWVPFNGDFGLHDAPWQTMRFGSPQWPTRGSHGCVHLPKPVMAWVYRWAAVGQTVVTITA